MAVDTTPDLAVSADISASALKVTLVINGITPPDPSTATSVGVGLQLLQAALGSRDERIVANDAFKLLYESFGQEQYWPIVNALWMRSEAEYPNFNWSALGASATRLKIAGLWGQWSREVKKDPVAPRTAAAFARSLLAAGDSQVRLEAISTLGLVGTLEDRNVLLVIATGNNEQAAIRATSAISAIERINKTSDSFLPSIAEGTQYNQVKLTVAQLKAINDK